MNDSMVSGGERPTSADNTETRLRAELAGCQATLAETRAARDQANRTIKALVDQETLLTRLVAVFDRAAAKGAS